MDDEAMFADSDLEGEEDAELDSSDSDTSMADTFLPDALTSHRGPGTKYLFYHHQEGKRIFLG